jgi:putative glycosyltransferase (TIGR04372 family)
MIWKKYSALIVVENRFLCYLMDYLKYYDDTNYDCSTYTAIHGRPPELHNLFYAVNNEAPLILWCENLLNKAKTLFKKNFPEIDVNKIIVLHARDSYFDKVHANPNYISQKHRNSELESYEEILNYLNRKGYSIFRIGTYKKHNKIPNINYHELCNLDSFQKELLEIYMISICKLFLGSPSGPLNLAIIWRRPLFALNMLPYAELRQVSINSMVVPKLLKKNGNLLTIEEIFDQGYHLLNLDDDFTNNGIECISNSSAECMDDFQEFFLAFVGDDQIAISNLLNSHEQKRYKDLCRPDSYDYNARGLIPRHYLFKKYVL